MDTLKAKQLAYDLTIEAVKDNHAMKNVNKENIPERIKYVSNIYDDILTEITKTNMNL